MFSHAYISANDFQMAVDFYSALLPKLGWQLKFMDPDQPRAGWHPIGQDRPLFVVGKPYDGCPATPGNGQMLALLAPTRSAVDASHAAALDHGAKCEGRPGLRPEYHPHYYGAYLRDLDGNKLCICCHDAPS